MQMAMLAENEGLVWYREGRSVVFFERCFELERVNTGEGQAGKRVGKMGRDDDDDNNNNNRSFTRRADGG